MPAPHTYSIVRSRRRTLGLQVNRQGDVIVRAPLHAPLLMIEKLVRTHTDWIIRTRARLAQLPEPVRRTLAPGTTLPYLGTEWPIRYGAQKEPVVFNEGFHIRSTAVTNVRTSLEAWYRSAARTHFATVAERIARTHHLQYTRLRLSAARTRWGSCSRHGSISLTWRLIFAPPAVVEYVICHELAHLLHHNHSAKFWAAVARLQPNFAEHRRWLKEHGHTLTW